MKKTFLSTLHGMMACMMAVCAIVSFTACSDDEVPAPQTFKGSFITSIPAMPNFDAINDENTVQVVWNNVEQTSATVQIGAFDIAVSTPMGSMAYEIGAMTITEVPCVKEGKKIALKKPAFQCMAGTFDTTGSLEGVLENGKLTMTLVYKPGTMPFEVQSVFEGK